MKVIGQTTKEEFHDQLRNIFIPDEKSYNLLWSFIYGLPYIFEGEMLRVQNLVG